MTGELSDAIRAAVAATLRQSAGWLVDDINLRDTFYEVANTVATTTPDQWDCCPLCDEMTCDEGCALEPLRTAT